MKPVLMQSGVTDIFHYDQKSGALSWKKKTANCVKIGSRAGSDQCSGYREVSIGGVQYMEHIVVWLLVYGIYPPSVGMEVDHKNGIRNDNRISNLRIGTHAQNMQNQRKTRSDNELGVQGVKRHKDRFRVRLCLNGKQYHVGLFDSIEDAVNAHSEAKLKLHTFESRRAS